MKICLLLRENTASMSLHVVQDMNTLLSKQETQCLKKIVLNADVSAKALKLGQRLYTLSSNC